MARKPRINARALDDTAEMARGVATVLSVLSTRVHDDPELRTAYLMVDRVSTRLKQRAIAAELEDEGTEGERRGSAHEERPANLPAPGELHTYDEPAAQT
jgi:hypothetical protein